MKYECKIIGINPVWISALLTGTLFIVCSMGDNSVKWGYLGFEVLFPLYTVVVIGEWCKTRTDLMFDEISTLSGSLFLWIVRRFVLLFGIVSIFALVGIYGMTILVPGQAALDLLLTFWPTAFFLSSVCIFISLMISVPHGSTMAAGVLWLFSIMTMSLLRYEPVRLVYLFIRYAGINNTLWIANKITLVMAGIFLWGMSYIFCKKRIWGK